MLARRAIYLDSNAGALFHPAALDAVQTLLSDTEQSFSNPSSIHAHGRRAKRLLAEAKEKIALSLHSKNSGPECLGATHEGVDPEQLVLTASGTEANQLAIRSVLEPLLDQGRKPHWITTPVEHDSNHQLIDWVKRRGGSVSQLQVDTQGRPLPESLSDLWKDETALISVVWVNNETGVVSDIGRIAQEAQTRGVRLHLDGAQAWGKLPMDLEASGAHLVSFSGHKLSGFAGTGILWLKKGTAVSPLILGKQEKGRRGGTENLLGAVALGAAAGALDLVAYSEKLAPLRDRLEDAICKRIPGVKVNGSGAPRVANTSNFTFEGIEGEGLVLALDLAGYCVSAGSACSSGAMEPSHVLQAMGRSRQEALAAIRVSLPYDVEWSTLESFVDALEKTVSRLRRPRL